MDSLEEPMNAFIKEKSWNIVKSALDTFMEEILEYYLNFSRKNWRISWRIFQSRLFFQRNFGKKRKIFKSISEVIFDWFSEDLQKFCKLILGRFCEEVLKVNTKIIPRRIFQTNPWRNFLRNLRNNLRRIPIKIF